MHLHRLLREFFEAAPGMSIEDAVDTLAATGGSMLKMVHTHDGAAAACMAIAYGSAKDRKRLLKGMKGGLCGGRGGRGTGWRRQRLQPGGSMCGGDGGGQQA